MKQTSDKLVPRSGTLWGVHVGGVAWVTDGRWMARVEHVELDEVPLAAALRGQSWMYRGENSDSGFSPLIQSLEEKTAVKIMAILDEPEGLIEFSHTGLSIGMEDDLRTNLFLATTDECRWVNAAFIRDQWADCRFMSVPGGLEDHATSGLRVYNGGPDMLQAVIMPMKTPAVCHMPLSRLAEVLQTWGEIEHDSAERGE